jgi:nucleoside-diphosphate-sugar epimerase
VFIGVGNHFEYNTYSISKTTAERYAIMYARNFGTRVNIVRALNAVGPRQKWGKINKILPTFINKALRNEDIAVYGGRDKCSIMDMVYAGDVAKVLVDVLERTDRGEIRGEVFEAGTGIGYPVYEIAERVIKACNSNSKIVETPMRFGESERSSVVANKPYPIKYKTFDEVLGDTIEYYKKQL